MQKAVSEASRSEQIQRTYSADFLTTALEPIASDIQILQSQLFELIPSESETTRQVLEHILASNGKLIRPALFYYCCRLLDYEGEPKHSIATVCEYIHTASLLHDDVIDNSSLRRNKPTANRIWGDEASVLVGDLIYSRASEIMAESGSLDVVRTFANAIRLMSEGELLQLENLFNLDISEEKYFRIVSHKTAVLTSASCKAAAYLAKSPSEVEACLSNFGMNVGLAFQLVDDALDYTLSEERFGKPTGNDILEGKVTLPPILLREKASIDERAKLQKILDAGLDKNSVEYIKSLVAKYKTVESTLARAKEFSDLAISSLDIFPPSYIKENLIALTDYLVWREV